MHTITGLATAMAMVKVVRNNAKLELEPSTRKLEAVMALFGALVVSLEPDTYFWDEQTQPCLGLGTCRAEKHCVALRNQGYP